MKNLIITTALSLLISLSGIAQDCANTYKHSEANNCAPCSMSPQNQKVQNLLKQQEEIDKKIEKLEELVEKSEEVYSNYGNLEWGRDELDLDMSKAYHEALDGFADFDIETMMEENDGFFRGGAGGWSGYNPYNDAKNNATDAAYDMWRAFENAETVGPFFDPASAGVKSKEIKKIWGSSTETMHYLAELYRNSYRSFTLDCCDPTSNPHDFYYEAANNVEEQVEKLDSFFTNFSQVHEVHLEGIAYFAMGYKQYDADVKKDLERLRGLTFGGVVGDALVDAGVISQDQLDAFNHILNTYNDVTSMQNAIRNTFGDDAADVMSVLFGDYSISDLRGNMGEIIKNNPDKFKNLSKLNKSIPGKSKMLGKVLGAIGYAEMIYQVGIETLIALDAQGQITVAKDRWWTITQAYHLRTTQNLIENAIALYSMKHMLQALQLFISEEDVYLPVEMMCGKQQNPTPPPAAEITKGPWKPNTTKEGYIYIEVETGVSFDGTSITDNISKLDLNPIDFIPTDFSADGPIEFGPINVKPALWFEGDLGWQINKNIAIETSFGCGAHAFDTDVNLEIYRDRIVRTYEYILDTTSTGGGSGGTVGGPSTGGGTGGSTGGNPDPTPTYITIVHDEAVTDSAIVKEELTGKAKVMNFSAAAVYKPIVEGRVQPLLSAGGYYSIVKGNYKTASAHGDWKDGRAGLLIGLGLEISIIPQLSITTSINQQLGIWNKSNGFSASNNGTFILGGLRLNFRK